MKKRTFKLLSLIVALIAAVTLTVGYVFAWFFDKKNATFTINGHSAGAYFDSGDGSKEKPFVIANSTHMHNLAVLQNTGRFVTNGVQKQYYFEIKKTIDVLDMSKIYMPPIGNDEFPFIGIFNGNGKTVTDLKVTTNKTLLGDDYPTQSREDYQFSRAVGLFGMTGSQSDISNVILDNPLVDVANTNTRYFSTDAGGIEAAPQVAGIAVGFVAGKCSSIGVRAVDKGATLDMKVNGYSTFNSILGALGDNVSSAVTGGGHTDGTGGSGASFGSSFDVEDLLLRLQKIDANKKSATPSWLLPRINHGNTNPITAKLRKVPFAVTEESTYEGADAMEVVSNQNIGYVIGNQNAIMTSKELRFDPPMTLSGNEWVMNDVKNVPRWFYKYRTESGSYDTIEQNPSYGKTVFQPLTQDEFDELPQGIIDLLPQKVGDKERFTAIRLSQTYTNDINPHTNNDADGWSFHGQISIMGKQYGKGYVYQLDESVKDEILNLIVKNADGSVDDDMLYSWGENMKFSDYPGGIYLPNNAVWFKPQQLGKIKFIMYAEEMGEGFALVKITRKNATPQNPFHADINDLGWGSTADIELTPVMRTSLPKGVLLYFEHEVDATELAANNTEFMIMQYGNGGAQFLYLDLGSNAAEDTSGIDRTKSVSAIDFIYDGVEIKQGNPADDAADALIKVGDFIVKTSGEEVELYEASKTSVYFENLSTVFKLVFLRLHNEEGKHSGKTICLEQSNPVPDTSSKVKATFATYVCPTIGGGSGTVSGGGGGGTVTPTPEPDDPVAVTSVSISGAPATMTVGGTASLGATVSPNNATDKTVTWSSSNSNMAEVDSNGNVTAKAAGTVTITATAGGKSDSVTITVEAAVVNIPVTSVTLNKTTMSLKSAGATEKLTATVYPSNATDSTVSWSSDDESVATVDSSGNVTAVGNGTTTITAIAGGKSATCTVTVSISGTTGGIASGTVVTFDGGSEYPDGVTVSGSNKSGSASVTIDGVTITAGKALKIDSNSPLKIQLNKDMKVELYLMLNDINVNGTNRTDGVELSDGTTTYYKFTVTLDKDTEYVFKRGSKENQLYLIKFVD